MEESSDSMNVIVSCASKFHSDHMAYQLQKRGFLYRYITAHPFPASREPIEPRMIRRIPVIYFFLWIHAWLPQCLRFILPAMSWLASAWFDRVASRFVSDGDIVISWAWSSLRSIRVIQRFGGIAVVEECGSFNKHQDEFLRDEYSRLGIPFTQGTHPKILEREQIECNEANFILCPSEYVAHSLTRFGIDKNKIIVIPYGVDQKVFTKQPKKDTTFRVIFVGNIGVRKGVIYLFEALASLRLPRFECVLVGAVEQGFKPIFERYKKYVRHIPRIAHHELRRYYSDASCFVFPTLDEGMAYVLLEAMSCGLPVITTPHSGGEGVIREGVDGFIVPIRDPESIKNKIEFLYENPHTCVVMGKQALERSQEFTWDVYGQRLTEALEKIYTKT